MRFATCSSTAALTLTIASAVCVPAKAQERWRPPIRQSTLTPETARITPLTARDASRNDRWVGLPVRDVRWAPDGSAVYFRWKRRPAPDDLAETDPWFRADKNGRWVEEVPLDEWGNIPGSSVVWSAAGDRATWVRDGALYVWDAAGTGPLAPAVGLDAPARSVRFSLGGRAVDFESGERLLRYHLSGRLEILAAKHETSPQPATDAAEWLRAQQQELFAHVRRLQDERELREAWTRSSRLRAPQTLPVGSNTSVDAIQASPDGRLVTFRARTSDRRRPPTEYVDYVDESGYAAVRRARPKVGEPRDRVRMGIVQVDPTAAPDSVEVTWISLPEAGDRGTVPHGPYWNLQGDRAVVQFISQDHKDLWIVEVDVTTGATSILAHDRDDAWIGGPPIQANYLQPALFEWLPDGSFVFASERSGWSHLYRVDPAGTIAPLTEGEWEVRDAALSRDRSTWLLQAGREHPSDDQLYLMPAVGGGLTQLTDKPGRHSGAWSPDGRMLAVTYGETAQIPDLFLRDASPNGSEIRVTVSGTDAFYEHPLVRPEVVSFAHPDGNPVWAALFTPDQPNAERTAVVHIHGGGYRQFAHRGWTVYGWDIHLGFINYMLQRGYTVLDFDYRGSAGYGRDYRTDIARSMGIKDTDGAIAAAKYLVREHSIDSTRIGIYGVSYGGFLTLMAQFRYPGVFAAGIARAAVTDWAHYSDGWTSRILGVPHEDPEAYRVSSPIYYAEGLQDHLLITHGLVDNNVHFQDAARLTQRLIELGRDFEIMYYPVEPHTIQTEVSRYDYVRRATAFFDRHLLRRD